MEDQNGEETESDRLVRGGVCFRLLGLELQPAQEEYRCGAKVKTVNFCDELSSDDVFQETSTQYRAVEPEQWLQRHPEAGSSWPSWPETSQTRSIVTAGGGVIC